MFSIQSNRNRRTRQRRNRHSAIYTAPSGREYVVEVVSIDKRDNSAQIVYQWSKGKVVRAWVGASDIEAVS